MILGTMKGSRFFCGLHNVDRLRAYVEFRKGFHKMEAESVIVIHLSLEETLWLADALERWRPGDTSGLREERETEK